ncbi:hypothetical protein LCGC14_2950880 [marine sediment metagenome]|uniref:Uncharacterized protein n=1 Tax=marine sediment metagenome TaxID=412755 RepID=A0A0F8XFU8_9ZZZZ
MRNAYTGEEVPTAIPTCIYEGYTDARRISTRHERRLYHGAFRHAGWKAGNWLGRLLGGARREIRYQQTESNRRWGL